MGNCCRFTLQSADLLGAAFYLRESSEYHFSWPIQEESQMEISIICIAMPNPFERWGSIRIACNKSEANFPFKQNLHAMYVDSFTETAYSGVTFIAKIIFSALRESK
jgi:hypothetical protein